MGSKHSKKAVKYDIEQFSANPNNNDNNNNNSNSSPDNGGSKEVDVFSQVNDKRTKQEEPLEPEELLTENIFELLSCDLQMYILTFLCMRDLYHISLSCQHGAYLVLSPEADGYVWKLMASHLGFNNEETIRALMQELEERENIKEDDQPKNKSKKKNKMWKLFHRMTLDDPHSSTSKSITSSENGSDGGEKAIEVTEALEKQDQDNGEEGVVSPALSDDKEKDHSADENLTGEDLATNEGIVVDYPPNMWRSLVHSNLMKWAPETRTSDTDIKMHNNNKTISCERQSKWDTIRTNRKLEMGMVHGWEYVLDDHDNGGYNSYRVFVGIERSTYAFTEVGFDKIIGYNSEGVSYNVGEHTVHRDNSHQLNDRSVLHEKHFVFGTGDTIGIKLDLKNLSSSKKASMYLFKNNKYFMTISDIATKGIVYYPAISVIGHQKVSIRMKHPSMLDINNSV